MSLISILANLRRGQLELLDLDHDIRSALLAKTNWTQVLIALGYDYFKTSSGGSITILCRFHNEKTASLKLWPNGRFYCFGCGSGGDMLDFALAFDNLEVWRIWWQPDPNQLTFQFE